MARRRRPVTAALLLLAATLAALGIAAYAATGGRLGWPPATSPHAVAGPAANATVTRVIDGDTFDARLASGLLQRVRVIGIDTPEVAGARAAQCFGQEASARARTLLAGRSVRLEADPTQDDRDQYGRLLRHVFLPDGRSFAEVMIAEGYGREFTYRVPHRHRDAFVAAEASARTQRLGLWSPTTCAGRT